MENLYSEGRSFSDNNQPEKAYKIFLKGMHSGDCKCQYGVAMLLYSNKIKAKHNYEQLLREAYPELLKLANKGDAEAMAIICAIYRHEMVAGLGDKQTALRYCVKSAQAGYAVAQLWLGDMYLKGELVCYDFDKGKYWLEQAAKQEYAMAQFYLGCCYKNGEDGFEQNEHRAFRLIEKAAKNEHADAQFVMASYYLQGDYVSKDLQQASFWLKKAAQNGHKKAKEIRPALSIANAFTLGGLFGSKRNKNSHEDNVEEFYDELFDSEDFPEQNPMSQAVVQTAKIQAAEQLSSSESREDWIKAVGYFEELIKSNYAYKSIYAQKVSDLCMQIAESFEYGQESHEYEATKWYQKAADCGNDRARLYLGIKYYDGRGVDQDFSKALYAFRKSIDVGVEEGLANFYMGNCYAFGFGIPQDKGRALEYYYAALEYGFNCQYAIQSIKYSEGDSTNSTFRKYAFSLLKNNGVPEIYKIIKEDLQKDFGACWNLLKPNAQTSLITGVTFYVNMIGLGEEVYKTQDFSPAINEMAKALEIELAEFFFKGYICYLEENHVSPTSVDGLKKYLVLKSDGTYSYPDKRKTQPFSLGAFRFIAGVKKESAGDNVQMGQFVRSDGDKVSVASHILAYADRLFRMDAFDGQTRKRDIARYLVNLANGVFTIKEYRNPASHERIMSCSDAEVCGDILIKVKKLIYEFISKINF